MTIEQRLAADRDSMIRLLKGQTFVTGPFWLVNLLRFQPGGAQEYKKYAAAIEPAMRAVGARPIFASYTCRTVVTSGGALLPVDGVFIGEYPSPSSLIEMNKRADYEAAHRFRAAALLGYRDVCGPSAMARPKARRCASRSEPANSCAGEQ